MGKKASFSDVVNWLMTQAKQGKGAPQGGGDACCGGSEPDTPDAIIRRYLPKLTETMLEILCEAPFQGEATLSLPSGDAINFKGEMLLTTILSLTLRTLGGSLQ